MQTTLTTKQEHEAWADAVAYHTVYGAGTTVEAKWSICLARAKLHATLFIRAYPFPKREPLSYATGCVGNGHDLVRMRVSEWETAWHGLPPFQNVRRGGVTY